MKVRVLALALSAAALAACSGESGGKATLWITRDKGTHVLLVRKVPSGLTAMQALDRVADIKTRYAGRFVEAINGIEGSLSARDTVIGDTPAWRAMSLIVTAPVRLTLPLMDDVLALAREPNIDW